MSQLSSIIKDNFKEKPTSCVGGSRGIHILQYKTILGVPPMGNPGSATELRVVTNKIRTM